MCGSGKRVENQYIGVLKKEKRERDKDNQYKLKEAPAITTGLISERDKGFTWDKVNLTY